MSDRARTQGDLERTFRDVTDPGYSEPLEQGLGWDAVAADAAILARASGAIETNSQAFFLLPSSRQTGASASGAGKARAFFQVSRRAGSGDQTLRIPSGTRLKLTRKDSRGQPAQLEDYQIAGEFGFELGAIGYVVVEAEAVRPGNQANAPIADAVELKSDVGRLVLLASIVGQLLTDTGDPDVFSAGDVGRYLRIAGETAVRRVSAYSQTLAGRGQVVVEGGAVTGSSSARLLDWAELGVQVVQVSPFIGGRHATLDQIGQGERGMPRGPGEADLDYAYRVSSLPDVVTPGALERIIARNLSPLGIEATFHETRDPELQGFILDHTPLDAGAVCAEGWPWSGGLLLSDTASKRFFAVCVAPDNSIGSYGLYLDTLNAGINFYDCAEQGGDGGALGYDNAIATLAHDLETARAGGVAWALLERGSYDPVTFRTVELEVVLASSAPLYLDARDHALTVFFQELRPGQGTTAAALGEAIAGQLAMAGLNPQAFVSSADSLTAATPREKLEYSIAP